MERVKSFLKGAKAEAIFILLILGALVALLILIIVASIEKAVILIARLFGKKISFIPIFFDKEEDYY